MSIALATTAGVVAAGVVSNRPGIAMGATAVAATLAITRPNSRKSESEADEIGIELAAKAGYDPRAAVTLWRKMGAVGGEGPPQWLSTHPSPETREKDLSALIPKMMLSPVGRQAVMMAIPAPAQLALASATTTKTVCRSVRK